MSRECHSESRVKIRLVFRFLLKLEDGDPNDPAVLVTAVPNWTVGETFSTDRGREWRILAIDSAIDDELVERGSTQCSPSSRREV
jgi:hypothetical protein